MDENDGGSKLSTSKRSEKNALAEEIEVHGEIPQARFGHTVTIVAK